MGNYRFFYPRLSLCQKHDCNHSIQRLNGCTSCHNHTNMPKLNKFQRYRARKKLKMQGESIPLEFEAKKVGRKRSSGSDVTKLDRWRTNYHVRKMKHLGLLDVILTTKPTTTTMTLRPRRKHAKNLLLEKACDMINTWSTNLRESSESVRKLRKAMGDVRSEVGKCFKWIQTEENQFLLVFVSSISTPGSK